MEIIIFLFYKAINFSYDLHMQIWIINSSYQSFISKILSNQSKRFSIGFNLMIHFLLFSSRNLFKYQPKKQKKCLIFQILFLKIMQSTKNAIKEIQFVNGDQIHPKYTCTVCKDIVSGPTQLPCGHLHCMTCIEQEMKKKRQCPNCGVNIDRNLVLVIERQVQNEVNEFKVYCPHHPFRCNWKGLRGEYENHLNVCQQGLVPAQNDQVYQYQAEGRKYDPGSLYARLLNQDGLNQTEKQFYSNFFHYIEEARGDRNEDGQIEVDPVLSRQAAKKLCKRTSALRHEYPNYKEELGLKVYIEDYRQDSKAIEEQIQDHSQSDRSQKPQGSSSKKSQYQMEQRLVGYSQNRDEAHDGVDKEDDQFNQKAQEADTLQVNLLNTQQKKEWIKKREMDI
ncbi:hypothetical protein pb186bvf_020106 [Paramecium bursaria]